MWGLFLLALSATYFCVSSQFADSFGQAAYEDSESVLSFKGGLCVGEKCRNYEGQEHNQETSAVFEPQYPDEESNYPDEEPPYSVEQIHPEPQYPNQEPQYPDEQSYPTIETSTSKYANICDSLLTATAQIATHYPDIAPLQFEVIDQLIKYTEMLADMKSFSCNPAVKLLETIITAAETLRDEYMKNSHHCGYTEKPVEPTDEPDMEYEHTDANSDYSDEHKQEMTTIDYGSHEQTMDPYPEDPKEHETSIGYQELEPTEKPCPEEPYITTPQYKPSTDKPCLDGISDDHMPTEEIIAADEEYNRHPSPPFVGSVRGIPGVHYPNYTEIPITSFTCADKKCIPGFYADLETGCQVFHVCYEHRRESFLCPMGTVFNQPILACDYWYSSNCSLAPTYYDVNCKTDMVTDTEEIDSAVGDLITSIVDSKPDYPVEEMVNVDSTVELITNVKDVKSDSSYKPQEKPELPEELLDDLVKFLPVKAKVTVFSESGATSEKVSEDVDEVASDIVDKILLSTTRVVSKTRDVIAKIPEQGETKIKFQIKKPVILKPKFIKAAMIPSLKMKMMPKAKMLGKMAAVPIIAKLATKAVIPVLAKAKVAVPVAKVVAAKAAIPVKTKLALGKKFAVKAAIPIAMKSKLVAGKVFAKAAIPAVAKSKLVTGKVIASKLAVPLLAKTKFTAAVPIVAKAKLVVASKAAVPIAAKVFAVKAAIPIAAKVVAAKTAIPVAKVVAAKTAIPVAKVVAAKTAIPVAKAVAFKAPVLKTKILAASLPFAKAAILKATIPAKTNIAPALKAKFLKSAAIPIVKGKMMALPLAKSKFAAFPFIKAKMVKAAAISPLTKKALALGYMKLLKAKKLALMG